MDFEQQISNSSMEKPLITQNIFKHEASNSQQQTTDCVLNIPSKPKIWDLNNCFEFQLRDKLGQIKSLVKFILATNHFIYGSIIRWKGQFNKHQMKHKLYSMFSLKTYEIFYLFITL